MRKRGRSHTAFWYWANAPYSNQHERSSIGNSSYWSILVSTEPAPQLKPSKILSIVFTVWHNKDGSRSPLIDSGSP